MKYLYCRQGLRFAYALTLVLMGVLLLQFFLVDRADAIQLSNEDCEKCHVNQVSLISDSGKQHEKAITCRDCHVEHPPEGSKAVPQCSKCHDTKEKEHYAVERCLECHDPHSPLNIQFSDSQETVAVCNSCHAEQGENLKENPSSHTEMGCVDCHDSHGNWKSCLECHGVHASGMSYDVCRTCHQPHMPKVVKFNGRVQNAWCSECHSNVIETLNANNTKHHRLSCDYCHKYQHKLIPDCETCHGQPHGVKIHRKYSDCRECHVGPHDLEKP